VALIYEEIVALDLSQGMLFPAQNEETGSVCLKILFWKKQKWKDFFDGNMTIPSFDCVSVTQ